MAPVATPLRPSARLRVQELQAEIDEAVEEESVSCLRAALRAGEGCALQAALRRAHLPALRLLLRADGARCECGAPCGALQLVHGFVRPAERLEAVELLLASGAGAEGLPEALRRGDLEIAERLLEHGAAANGEPGQEPLRELLRLEGTLPPDALLSVCARLLRSGARPEGEPRDPELRGLLRRWAAWWRCRPLCWARSRGTSDAAAQLRHLMPELLLSIARFL